MKIRAKAFVIFMLAAAASPSCSKVDGDVFDGSYSGTFVDSQSSSNVKQFTLNASVSGTGVSGSYTLKAVILDVSGSVTGTLNGSSLALTLTPGPTSNDCVYQISATWGNGRIDGAYQAVNCPVRSDGRLGITKR